jgi:hypothetical protein
MWYGKYVIILSALEGCSKSSFKASKLLKLFILIEPYLVIGDTVRGIQLKKKKKTIPPPPGGTAILPEYIHYYGYYYQVIVQCLST